VFLEVPRELPFGLARVFPEDRANRDRGFDALAMPSSLYLMHEHINYFSGQSLATLMRPCGCSLIGAASYAMDSGVEKAQMVWCLGTSS
jgi:hypothetical protein